MQVEISLSMSTGNGKNKFKVTENLEQPDENKLSGQTGRRDRTARRHLRLRPQPAAHHQSFLAEDQGW